MIYIYIYIYYCCLGSRAGVFFFFAGVVLAVRHYRTFVRTRKKNEKKNEKLEKNGRISMKISENRSILGQDLSKLVVDY